MQDDFSDTELGKPSPAVSQYTPSLLFPIERSRVRASRAISHSRGWISGRRGNLAGSTVTANPR
jgi:NADPH-dependent 7-cyano-7-deazaguanine reductase QueF-like protein